MKYYELVSNDVLLLSLAFLCVHTFQKWTYLRLQQISQTIEVSRIVAYYPIARWTLKKSDSNNLNSSPELPPLASTAITQTWLST